MKYLVKSLLCMNSYATQRYTHRVLQTIQMKLILLCVWAEPAVWAAIKLLKNSNMKSK